MNRTGSRKAGRLAKIEKQKGESQAIKSGKAANARLKAKMNTEFQHYKRGMLEGNASAFTWIANWIEEDLLAGRDLTRYPAVLRKWAAEFRAEAAETVNTSREVK